MDRVDVADRVVYNYYLSGPNIGAATTLHV